MAEEIKKVEEESEKTVENTESLNAIEEKKDVAEAPTKKKKKIKPADGRKKPKHSGIVGKGRGYDEVIHKIPKKTLE